MPWHEDPHSPGSCIPWGDMSPIQCLRGGSKKHGLQFDFMSFWGPAVSKKVAVQLERAEKIIKSDNLAKNDGKQK